MKVLIFNKQTDKQVNRQDKITRQVKQPLIK